MFHFVCIRILIVVVFYLNRLKQLSLILLLILELQSNSTFFVRTISRTANDDCTDAQRPRSHDNHTAAIRRFVEQERPCHGH